MKQNAKQGFTLLELLVAIAVFSIIVSIAVGGFVNALHTQREVAALIAAESNAGTSLEQIVREVRTGYLFCHVNDATGTIADAACATPTPCSFTGTGGLGSTWTCPALNFYNAQGCTVLYALANGNALTRTSSCEGGGAAQPLTGDNVAIKYLQFTLFGNLEGDHWNPRITISIGISPSSTDPALASNIVNLQTTVSARSIDCSASAGC